MNEHDIFLKLNKSLKNFNFLCFTFFDLTSFILSIKLKWFFLYSYSPYSFNFLLKPVWIFQRNLTPKGIEISSARTVMNFSWTSLFSRCSYNLESDHLIENRWSCKVKIKSKSEAFDFFFLLKIFILLREENQKNILSSALRRLLRKT